MWDYIQILFSILIVLALFGGIVLLHSFLHFIF